MEELIGGTVEHTDYWDWKGFEGVNLEESHVREIRVGRTIVLMMDLVLNEQHPRFNSKKEKYYRGQLVFFNVTEYIWTGQHVRPALRDSEPDLGAVDSLYFENGWYYMIGEWGELRFQAVRRELVVDPHQ